jgi:hypothetical protein
MQSRADTRLETPSDRRIFPRTEVQGHVVGKRVGFLRSVRTWPRLEMEIQDLSLGGMSAMSPMPLKAGEKLDLHLHLQPNTGEWDARGRVVRCEPSATGRFRIAVAFDALKAA